MQTIYIDISNKGIIPAIYAKQGDVGRKFLIKLTNNGEVYHIPDGVTFSVWYSGASGEGNYTHIGDRSAFVIDCNTVTVELITQMLNNAGEGKLCLVMSGADGSNLASWNIPYAVEYVPGMGSDTAEQYFTAFSEVIKDLPYPDVSLAAPGKAADAAAVGAALRGKAPAGYGLGAAEGKSWKDVDSITQPGWYAFYDSVDVAGYTFGAAGMRVDALDANSIIQTIHPHYTPMVELKRHFIAGVLYDWEWVNPLMHLNREYRTTRRRNGKPEYTMFRVLGEAPVEESRSIPHGIADVQEIDGEFLWFANGETTKGNAYFVNGALGAYAWATADSVGVRSVSVDTTGITVSVVLRYTKTTD